VLNAVTHQPDRRAWADWQRGRASADGVSWPICFSATVAVTIRRLHLSGLAEVRWLSTWGRYANGELRELVGLPELAVAGERPVETAVHDTGGTAARTHGDTVAGHGRWWKLAAAEAVVAAEPTRAIIWADDELRHHLPAARAVVAHTRHLLVSPPPTVGLTPRLLREVVEFCGDPM
jgi:hypothetical protein